MPRFSHFWASRLLTSASSIFIHSSFSCESKFFRNVGIINEVQKNVNCRYIFGKQLVMLSSPCDCTVMGRLFKSPSSINDSKNHLTKCLDMIHRTTNADSPFKTGEGENKVTQMITHHNDITCDSSRPRVWK